MSTNQPENTVVNKQPDGEKRSGEGCWELGRIKDMAGKQTTQTRKDAGIAKSAASDSSRRRVLIHRIGAYFLIIGLVAPSILSAQGLRGSTMAQIDQVAEFISFLTNRPNIKQISYSQKAQVSDELIKKLAPNDKFAPGVGTNVGGDVVVGFWQTNQYHIKVTALGIAGSKQEAWFGFNAPNYWQISGGNVTLCPSNETSYATTLSATLGGFLDVLNLGIPNVEHGSAKWTGKMITGLSPDGLAVTGHLTVADGLPSYLDCEVSGGNMQYRITYHYAAPLENNLPSAYSVSAKPPNGNVYHTLTKVDILSIETSKSRIIESLAVPYMSDQYKKASMWVHVENGQYVFYTPAGKRLNLPATKIASNSFIVKFVTVACFASVSVLALWWVLKFGKPKIIGNR